MLKYLRSLNEKRFLFFEIGLIIALTASIVMFNWKFYTPEQKDQPYYQIESDRIEQIDIHTPRTTQRTFGPPPPNVVLNTLPLSGNIQTVLENSLQESQLASTEVMGANDVAIPASAFGRSGDLPGEGPTAEPEIFVIVEEMPEFPGGAEALLRYLHENIRYPQMARENRIEGLVVVQFIIDEKGVLSNVTVLRGIGGGCDEEAVRVIKTMPAWKPGVQRGIPVKVRYNVPVRFVLKVD